jgi:DNA-binding beta-propeller fold protein YncE
MPQQIFFYLMKLPSFAMRFEFPKGIAVDASGYVYVADDAKHRIQKSDTNGNFRKE